MSCASKKIARQGKSSHLGSAHITDDISQHFKLLGLHDSTNLRHSQADLLPLTAVRGSGSATFASVVAMTGSAGAGGLAAGLAATRGFRDAELHLERVKHAPAQDQHCCYSLSCSNAEGALSADSLAGGAQLRLPVITLFDLQ